MTGPTREIPGLVEFLNKGLLPQDLVALLAYNRATDFTTRSRRAARPDRPLPQSEREDRGLLEQHFSGLRAIYGSKEIPDGIQAGDRRRVRGRPHAQAPRDPAGPDHRRQAIAATRGRRPPRSSSPDVRERTEDFDRSARFSRDRARSGLDISFDDYIADQVELMQDLGNLYAGIDYSAAHRGRETSGLRDAPGFSLPRLENDRSLGSPRATRASSST